MTFEQLEDLFYSLKINASPSAFHGFLCGRLTCGAVEIEHLIEVSSAWLALSEEQADVAESELRDFYETSLSNLASSLLAFKTV